LKEAALGDANQDSINRGTFYGLFLYPEP